jgi:D-sedoheptulose 7-phosphate isomerase
LLKSNASSSKLLLSSVKENALAYFRSLSELLVKTYVTDLTQKALPLEDGLGQALEKILSLKETSGKVMLIGNGGSAAIASHQAIDFWKVGGIRATAFNDLVQLTCLSNDLGYENVFSTAIDMFAQPGDVLIAISSSGRSQNILNGAQAARKRECSVISFAGFSKSAPLLELGDLNFFVDSNNYGLVELSHLALIHYLADMVCTHNKE